MKIKFNWGTGITIVIILFLGTVFWRIYLAAGVKIDLVSDDYYPKELKYQEQIDRVENSNTLSAKVKVIHQSNVVNVLFPNDFEGKQVQGILHFYCPSNFERDFSEKINLSDSLNQQIDVNKLDKGRFILKIYWESDSVTYYAEHELMI